MLTGFTAPKILWVRKHEPEVYARTAHILLPKDYVRFRLTGEYAMDKADGAGMLLFDLKRRDWSPEMLAALEIPAEWLPKSYEGPEVTGQITAEAAALTGLQAGTPVMAGGGDQAAGAVGVGAVVPGIVSLTLGTSGVVFATTAEPYIEPEGRLHAFCHSVPGMWHLMGVMLSAAGILRWYRDTLAPGASFDDVVAPAAAGAAGERRPVLPALPHRRAHAAPRPAGARRVRRADRAPHAAAHDARRARRGGVRPARQHGADPQRRARSRRCACRAAAPRARSGGRSWPM